MKLFARATLVAAVTLGTLALSSCIVPVAVSGPCTAQSNSTVTLDVYWSGADVTSGAPAGLRSTELAKKFQRSKPLSAARPSPRSDANGDSTLVMIEAPSTWTPTTASWEGVLVNGVPESGVAVLSDTPSYCTSEFAGAVRPGYTRKYFKITPSSQVNIDSTDAVLHVTYATGVLSTGVYHPMVMSVIESDTEPCYPGTAFHRITVGAPEYIPFSVSPFFNSDVVVNGADATQDALLTIGNVSYALTTDVIANSSAPALPSNGLLTTAGAQAFFLNVGVPKQFDVPECVPDYQAGFSSLSNGSNAWLPAAVDDALTVPVPLRRYSEVAIYVTGSIVPPDPDLVVGATPTAMHVTFHYEGGGTGTMDVSLPFGGLPLFLPEGATGMAPVPAFTMALSATVPITPGNDGQTGLGGISAVLLSPDPTRRLQSITIVPFDPVVATAAVGGPEQKVAIWGAFGMALPDPLPDIAVTKQVLGSGPVVVGSKLVWRITATNQGAAVSNAVTITDTLPPSVSYFSATPSSGSCSFLAGTLTCNVGTLAVGASATVDVTATVLAAGPIVNTATSASAGDANGQNNTGSATVTAGAAPEPIPSLSTFGIALLAALLTLAAAMRLRL